MTTPNRGDRRLGWARAAALLALVVCGGCAVYRVGNASLYPSEISTVYVPIIESTSYRRHLGEQLTELVQKQIERTTPYKVVGSAAADSVLSGRLVQETKRVLVESPTDEVREAEVNLVLELSWVDRQGGVVQEMPAVPIPVDVARLGQTASVVAEYGESVATAQQQAMQRLAEQVVGLMESPW